MCWNTQLNVILQRDTPAARESLTPPPTIPYLVLQGRVPAYVITNGVCGCGSVNEPDGTSLPDPTLGYLRHFLAQPIVKRVEMQWWWGDDHNRPTNPTEQRLTLEDFERRSAANDLLAGTTYRINHPPAFKGRKG